MRNQQQMGSQTRLVFLDMDGVVFDGKNFWLELHRAYGTEDQAWRLMDEVGDDYQRLSEITAGELWRGKPAAPYWELVRRRSYTPQIREVVRSLTDLGIRLAIVSSGPWHLAERARCELGLTVVRANRLFFEDGVVAGTVEVQVDDNDKLTPAREIAAELDVQWGECALIGDGRNDVPLAGAVPLSFAYDSSCSELRATAQHVLARHQLSDVLKFVVPAGST